MINRRGLIKSFSALATTALLGGKNEAFAMLQSMGSETLK